MTNTASIAAQALAIATAIYPLLQALKRIPQLTAWLKGWWAFALNILLSIGGAALAHKLTVTNFFSVDTLVMVIEASSAAGWAHGTVVARSEPQVLATFPPDPQVEKVAATLQPVDPKAVAVTKE